MTDTIESLLRRLEPQFHPDLQLFRRDPTEARRILGCRDGFHDVFVWIRRRSETRAYHFEGAAVAAGNILDKSDLSVRVGAHLLRHQQEANACLARAFCRRGVPALASLRGVDFGNGRSLSAGGFWFVYQSNDYREDPSPGLSALVEGEAQFVCKVLLVACSFACWIGVRFPDADELASAETWARPVTFVTDPRVVQFRDERSTLLCRNLMAAGHENIDRAQRIEADVPPPTIDDGRGPSN